MLVRSTYTLTTEDTAILPRSYHLELVKRLHDRLDLALGQETIPSVTCSGLIGRCSGAQGFLEFQAGEPYQLILTGLDEGSAKAIANAEFPDTLEFLGSKFSVRDRTDERSSYEELYSLWVATEPETERRLNLEFLTPTSFSQQGSHLPLPVPALMFRSWLERWNHFAPIYLGGDELIGYLQQFVHLRYHQIKTRSFQLPRAFVTGFVGNVSLQIPYRVEPIVANVANLLARYAVFSGTGVKTRLGMGQTELEIFK
ncbi:MAG: CRISPR system precrRNA processing endoribonuclease RAMP protein Cas6 [Cyanobacteria bacterium SID2]|nr:CRISPR system precrRNA processing endoribonuclease RAMP protein Cas6 [Cyanobacteria bacterium SID2]